jgi:hypothetical protein
MNDEYDYVIVDAGSECYGDRCYNILRAQSATRHMGDQRSIWRPQAYLMLIPLLDSNRALAHAWGNSYSLSIPFAMYAYGATAALVISFVLVSATER